MSQRKSRFSQEHKDLLADFKKDGSGELDMAEFLKLPDDPIDEQASVCKKLVGSKKTAKGLYYSLANIQARHDERDKMFDDLNIDGNVTLDECLSSPMKTQAGIKYLQLKRQEIKDAEVEKNLKPLLFWWNERKDRREEKKLLEKIQKVQDKINEYLDSVKEDSPLVLKDLVKDKVASLEKEKNKIRKRI